MKRLVLAISCAVLLCGCGGTSSGGSPRDEANVVFKRPMLLTSVLEMAHRHHVQPTELTMEFAMLGETISSHAVIEPGLSDDEVVSRVRESASGMAEGMEGSMLSDSQMANLREVQRRARSGPLHIVRMLASGAADDLRSLRREPGVRLVGLKSEILKDIRSQQ